MKLRAALRRVAKTGAQSSGETGASLIEFSLVILPLLGFIFLTMDVAWVIFARASLQQAVREGVRYGVTGQVLTGQPGLDASIRQVVQQNSFGFISSANISDVSVAYYSQGTLVNVTHTPTATAGGNILQVTVSGVSVKSFGPFFRSSTPLILSAIASDVMESPHNGILPVE